MCNGILFFGCIMGATTNFAEVKRPWLPMLGGAAWTLGNLLCIPLINRLGLGLGVCLWGVSAMVFGWSGQFFGILGMEKKPVSSPALNIIGVVLAAAASACYLMGSRETRYPPFPI